MQKIEIENTIRKIVSWLISKDYSQLFINDFQKSISPEEIQSAIKDYRGNLTMPNNECFINDLDIYEISENKITVDFDLWFDDKRSDLTLSCTIINENGNYKYSIDNIHVL